MKVDAVRMGDQFSRLGDGLYSMRPGQRSDYDALIQDLRARDRIPAAIVHLWSVTPENQTALRLADVDRAQESGFYSLLFLTQAMGDHNLTSPARIAVVSNHLQDVTGEESLDPQKATVLGPVAVIPLEYQNLKCVSIDVTLPPLDSSAEHRLIHQLIAELTAAGPDSVVAYRRQHRWVQTFVPGRLDGEHPSGQELRLRDQGVYLVAGGTGGVGLALAEWLAKSAKHPRLVLTARKELPARDTWETYLSDHDGSKPEYRRPGVTRGSVWI